MYIQPVVMFQYIAQNSNSQVSKPNSDTYTFKIVRSYFCLVSTYNICTTHAENATNYTPRCELNDPRNILQDRSEIKDPRK